MGEKILNIIRVLHNKILYFILSVISRFFGTLQVFPGTNGDCITFAWRGYVYKFFSVFFAFNPNRSFFRFKQVHYTLRDSGIRNIPKFAIGRFYVRYELIESQDLLSFLKLADRDRKIRILRKILHEINGWHEKGFIHLDFKPKNILIDVEENVYFIDFENVTKAVHDGMFAIDYEKLIPRIAYFFTRDEFLEAASGASKRFSLFVERYCRDFDYKEILDGFDFVSFEKEAYDNNEDVDITIDSPAQIAAIVARVRKFSLDHFFLFRSQDDVKLYVFNLHKVILIDIHINNPFRKISFLYNKLFRHRSVQIALTGPDGVGKTTLLSLIKNDNVRGLDFDVLHAGRFIKGQTVFAKLRIAEKIANRLSLGYFSIILLYQRLIRRNTKPLIFFDRSFFDDFIDRNGNFHRWYFVWLRWLVPSNVRVILLKDDPVEIAKRKSELDEERISRYYAHAERRFPIWVILKKHTQGEAFYSFVSIARYLRFTQKKFL